MSEYTDHNLTDTDTLSDSFLHFVLEQLNLLTAEKGKSDVPEFLT
jgi:hypothetical protein